MQISDTTRKILEKRQSEQGMAVSDSTRQILERRQEQARLASIPFPDMPGFSANSTEAVKFDDRSSLSKIAFGGLLGGADLKDYGIVAKDLVQGTVRGGFATGNVLAGAALGMTPAEVGEVSFMPQGLAKMWLSDQAVGLASEGVDVLTSFGVDPVVATNIAPGLLVGLTALDGFTGGGKGQGLKNLSRGLQNARTAEEAAQLMRSVGYADDIIFDYAPLFAKSDDATEIVKMLESSANLQNTTKVVESAPPRTLSGVDVVTPKGNALSETVSTFKSFFAKAADEVGLEVKTGSKSVSDYRSYVGELEQAGYDVAQMRSALDEISSTMKTDPARFTAKEVAQAADDSAPVVTKTDEVADDVVEQVITPEPTKIKATDFRTADDVPEEMLEKVDFAQPETFKKGEKIVISRTDDMGGATTREFATVGAVSKKTGGIRLDTKLPGGKISSSWYDARFTTGSRFSAARINPELPAKVEASAVAARKLDEVADPMSTNMGVISFDVQNRYGRAAVTGRNVEKVKKVEQTVFNEIYTFAQEAAFLAKNGGEITRTMPTWVPNHLKDVKVFDGLLEILGKGEVPKVHGGPYMELYTSMVDEVAKRAGITAKGPLPAIDGNGALLQSMRQDIKTPNETLALREPSVTVVEPKVIKKNEIDTDEAFDTWRGRHGEEARLSMPVANPEDMKFLDDITDIVVDDKNIVKTGKFTAFFNDVYATSQKVLGDAWPIVKENLFDKFDAAKGRYARETMDLQTRLKEEVLDKYKIKRKSKESAHIMDFGEGLMTEGQLVREYGRARADELIEATGWFRMMYDEMIEQINIGRPEGRKIAHRGKADANGQGGYFRHFQEMSNFGQLINNFENPSLGNLDNASLKDTARRFSFTKQRKGFDSTRDALGGFLDYIPQYSYEKNINPEIPKITAFIQHLKAQGGDSVQNYAQFLDVWANDLAFGYNVVDAGLDWIPGSRRSIEVGNWFNNRVKRNAVLGNVGTAFAQAFTLPNLASEAGPVHMMHGMGMYKVDAFTENALWKQSDFLTERFMNSTERAFAVGFWEKTTNKTGFMIGALDQVAATSGWYALLSKAQSLGLEGAEAIKYADDATRQMVGGRGIGEVAIMQKSKLFQIAAPFTLEAVKTLQILKGRIKNADNAELAYWLAATYYMNEGIEHVTGQRVSMDPVNAFQDMVDIQNDTEEEKGVRSSARMAGEIVSSIPLGKYVLKGIQSMSGMDDDDRKKYFGEGDPLRYGGTPLLVNAVAPAFQAVLSRDEELTDKNRAALLFESFLRIGMPQGGNQIRKSIEGSLHLTEEDPDPSVRPGLPGIAQNVLFGKWSPNIQYEESQEDQIRKDYLLHKSYMDGDDEEKKATIKAVVNGAPDEYKAIYKKVAGEEKEKEEYRQMEAMRPLYRQVAAMNANGHRDKAKALVMELSKEEQKIFKEVAAEAKTQAYETGQASEENPESVIREVLDYAYAIGTNPIQAFEHIFNGQHIEGVVGETGSSFFFGGMVKNDGMVVVRRMPHLGEGGSDEVKREWMEEQGIEDSSTVSLEHKLPLSLGGNNTLENLELVPKAAHDSWTAMEVRLSRAVKAGRINYVEAQELILRYKGYEGEPITDAEIEKLIGGNSISDDEIRQNPLDRLGDTWLFSDEDYADRKDPITGQPQGKRTKDHIERDKLLEATK